MRSTRDIDVFGGDMGTGGAPSVPGDEYGPLSPAQLAALSRPLTAEEQKAVDQWRGVKPAPKASSLSSLLVTPRKAPAATQQPSFLQREAFGGLVVWQAGLLGIGALAVTTGLILALVKRK